MTTGIKLLVSGFEASGKSTLTSGLEDALVFNFDRKEYSFSVPHVNFKEYTGMQVIIDTMVDKIHAYKEKFGKYPSNIVLDTVTQLYNLMQTYNSEKYTGFTSHNTNLKETGMLNEFIEKELIPQGFNVIVAAHTKWDEATSRHVIPATGSFKDSGSWLSIVNEAIFIEKKSNKLTVHLHGLKYPCRTFLTDLPEYVDIDNFDFKKHVEKLTKVKAESKDFQL